MAADVSRSPAFSPTRLATSLRDVALSHGGEDAGSGVDGLFRQAFDAQMGGRPGDASSARNSRPSARSEAREDLRTTTRPDKKTDTRSDARQETRAATGSQVRTDSPGERPGRTPAESRTKSDGVVSDRNRIAARRQATAEGERQPADAAAPERLPAQGKVQQLPRDSDQKASGEQKQSQSSVADAGDASVSGSAVIGEQLVSTVAPGTLDESVPVEAGEPDPEGALKQMAGVHAFFAGAPETPTAAVPGMPKVHEGGGSVAESIPPTGDGNPVEPASGLDVAVPSPAGAYPATAEEAIPAPVVAGVPSASVNPADEVVPVSADATAQTLPDLAIKVQPGPSVVVGPAGSVIDGFTEPGAALSSSIDKPVTKASDAADLAALRDQITGLPKPSVSASGPSTAPVSISSLPTPGLPSQPVAPANPFTMATPADMLAADSVIVAASDDIQSLATRVEAGVTSGTSIDPSSPRLPEQVTDRYFAGSSASVPGVVPGGASGDHAFFKANSLLADQLHVQWTAATSNGAEKLAPAVTAESVTPDSAPESGVRILEQAQQQGAGDGDPDGDPQAQEQARLLQWQSKSGEGLGKLGREVASAFGRISGSRETRGSEAAGGGIVTDVRSLLMQRDAEVRQLQTPTTVAGGDPLVPGRAGFAQAMGERVMMLMTQKVTAADIVLDPRELGPIEVKIRQDKDQTTLVFASHHPAVREQLEASLPKLKDMFTQAGLSLGSVSVGDRQAGSDGGQQGGQRWQGAEPQEAQEPGKPSMASRKSRSEQAVDYYA